jgi:hypothetical protein
MPDLQTELKKLEALSFNDAGEPKQMSKVHFQPTNNVTREVFNYVRDNPGLQRKDVIKNMRERGFNDGSTTSLIGQFLRQNKFKFIHGTGLAATQQEYTPLKSLKSFNNAKKDTKVTKVTKVTAKKKEAPIMEAVPAVNHDTLVKAMLGRMSIVQAREMYDELKQIFEVKC